MTSRIDEPTRSSGALIVAGDLAIAHDDLATLAHVCSLLAPRASPSLGADLQDLAELCVRDVELAARRWPLLREQLFAELETTLPQRSRKIAWQ